MPIHEYPYTDFHEMNLDWIIKEMKQLIDEWAEFEHQYTGITAEAQTVPYGSGADVTVTGGGDVPFNFSFDIPAGKDLRLASSIVKYGTSPDTATPPVTWYDTMPVVPQGEYLWTRVTLNFNDGSQTVYYTTARNGLDGTGSVVSVNNISPDGTGNVTLPLPTPSDNTPLMDTLLGSEGVSAEYSRADHQHISDTSKLDKQSGSQATDLNAYVIDGISTQTIKPISKSAEANAIAMYTANGTLVVNEPQSVNEAPRLLDVQNGFVSNADIVNYVSFTNTATTNDLGIIKPDGTTTVTDVSGVLSAVPNGLLMSELWTNSSPGTNFSSQTLSLNLSDYQQILVYFRMSTAAAYNYSPIFMIRKGYDQDTRCILMIGSGPSIGVRTCKWDNTHVYFGPGQLITGTATNNDMYMIPIKIYGIK